MIVDFKKLEYISRYIILINICLYNNISFVFAEDHV